MVTKTARPKAGRPDPRPAPPPPPVYADLVEAMERFAEANFGDHWRRITVTVEPFDPDRHDLVVQHPPGG